MCHKLEFEQIYARVNLSEGFLGAYSKARVMPILEYDSWLYGYGYITRPSISGYTTRMSGRTPKFEVTKHKNYLFYVNTLTDMNGRVV